LTGAAAAFALTRILSGLLYGVRPRDPLTFAAVLVILGAGSLIACWLPARRATTVDPLVVLRAE
jgi:ABC-type lipoprotein release transport system permease subunit